MMTVGAWICIFSLIIGLFIQSISIALIGCAIGILFIHLGAPATPYRPTCSDNITPEIELAYMKESMDEQELPAMICFLPISIYAETNPNRVTLIGPGLEQHIPYKYLTTAKEAVRLYEIKKAETCLSTS